MDEEILKKIFSDCLRGVGKLTKVFLRKDNGSEFYIYFRFNKEDWYLEDVMNVNANRISRHIPFVDASLKRNSKEYEYILSVVDTSSSDKNTPEILSSDEEIEKRITSFCREFARRVVSRTIMPMY